MHQIRLRPFDCCLPLCLHSSLDLGGVLLAFDPFVSCFILTQPLAIALAQAAREDHHIHRIDVPGEVL